MARVYLPQCEVCKHYEHCVTMRIDKKSLFCLLNFYTEGFVFDYYQKHLKEYAIPEERLIEELYERDKT